MSAPLCRSGRHAMTADNVRTERCGDRVVRRCRACRAESWQRPRKRSLYDVSADRRVDQAIPLAARVVGAVREGDRDAVAELVAGADWPALLVALAAMVPEDRTPSELLAWHTTDAA